MHVDPSGRLAAIAFRLTNIISATDDPFNNCATERGRLIPPVKLLIPTLRAEGDNVAGLSESGGSMSALQNRSWARQAAGIPTTTSLKITVGSPDSENPATLGHLRAGRCQLQRGVSLFLGHWGVPVSTAKSDTEVEDALTDKTLAIPMIVCCA
jgi:hypothetical protein